MPLTSTSRVRVRYAETDQMRVVYHANYLVWLEIARTDLIRSRGLTYAEIEKSGVGLTVAELGIRYRASARYDDEIAVTATLAELRSRSMRIEYELKRESDDTVLATAYTALVSIDTSTGRPTAIPPGIAALFREA